MTATPLPTIPAAPVDSVFLRDVIRGLGAGHKSLPCKYFYDAVGSRLFDRICALEEYYPTRAELDLLTLHGTEIADVAGPGVTLVEYGSGSSVKTGLLLDRFREPAVYVPVDISREHLLASAHRLARRYPDLPVLPVCADFTGPFELPVEAGTGRRVVYFSGSTIGNFSPGEAVRLLAGMARLAGPEGGLLIALDLKKDRAILEPAYNDRLGVTATFNLNLLARINRELRANFALDRFRHLAVYNEECGRIEMLLISLEAQRVRVGGRTFSFEAGETICTEHSHKYSPTDVHALAGKAGLNVRHFWTDSRGLFSVAWMSRAE
jgi:L-histidine Nalpha-methyltransferase